MALGPVNYGRPGQADPQYPDFTYLPPAQRLENPTQPEISTENHENHENHDIFTAHHGTDDRADNQTYPELTAPADHALQTAQFAAGPEPTPRPNSHAARISISSLLCETAGLASAEYSNIQNPTPQIADSTMNPTNIDSLLYEQPSDNATQFGPMPYSNLGYPNNNVTHLHPGYPYPSPQIPAPLETTTLQPSEAEIACLDGLRAGYLAAASLNRAAILNRMNCACPRWALLPSSSDGGCVDCEALMLAGTANHIQPPQARRFLLPDAHIVDPDETISYVSDNEDKYSETTIDDPLFRVNGVRDYYR